MKVFRLAVAVTATIAFVTLVVGVFLVAVPIDFAAHVRGRIEPAATVTVSLPRGGGVTFCRAPGPVKKGDLLVSLDTAPEEHALAGLDRLDELLRREYANELELKAASGRAHASEIAQCQRDVERLSGRLEAEQGRLAALETDVAGQRRRQSGLTESLRGNEVGAMTALRQEGLVTESELEVARYRAAIAVSEREQTDGETEQSALRRQSELRQLNDELRSRAAALDLLTNSPSNLRNLLAVEQRIEAAKQQRAELQARLDEKRGIAPFDGELIHAEARVGQTVKAGEALMTLADNSAFVFLAEVDPSVRIDLVQGQDARLSLDHYPARTFEYIPSKLERIETSLAAGGQATYRLTLSVGRTSLPLLPGLPGMADIVIFHGTTVRYLTRQK